MAQEQKYEAMKALFAIWLALLVVFIVTIPGRADVAPPQPPPGANLLPGDEGTQVRMVAETVLIEVLQNNTSEGDGKAHVTANFTMRNLGEKSETLAVRFPISANDGFYNYPEISNLHVKINGKNVATRRITIPDPEDKNYPLPWAEFDASFPSGKDVEIEVTYTLRGAQEYPYINFGYILETGAGWRGTIGSADLIVRLPYEASPSNILIDSGWGMAPTSPGVSLTGKEIRWHYENIEPTRADNLWVALLMPSAWNEVLKERANVTQNPQDGEAWGRLGRIYKITSRLRRGLRDDAGGQELFALGASAYEKAVELLPEDALWHAGFAELLFDGYYWKEYYSPEKPGLLRALQEINLAYQLDQTELFILDLIDEMRSALPSAVSKEGDIPVFLWLTATPTFLPSSTPTPSLTPSPSPTRASSLTPNPATPTPIGVPPAAIETASPEPTDTTPPPAASPSFTLCGTAILIPLVILFKRYRK